MKVETLDPNKNVETIEPVQETHIRKPCPVNEKILKLFKGKFEELPILDLNKRERKFTTYIDFVKPDDMTAPIMRSIDSYNCVSFTIRAEKKYGIKERICQTFFQRFNCDSDIWADGACDGKIISVSSYLINGEGGDKKAYQELADFIEKGENEYFILA